MNSNIFLEENRSVMSNNVENSLNIDLISKNRLLPDESLVDNFSLYEQYNRERDECSKYRFIFDINALCSNVLFNVKSEIVVNEGSDYCRCLNFEPNGWQKATFANNAVNTKNPIKYIDAIRNTEYSHKNNGKFVYHCGVDIFNNHMLRKKDFIHINKIGEKYPDDKKELYNTISDYLRDSNGNVIKENLGIKYTDQRNEVFTERHIYSTDSLYTLKNAFYERCRETEGWWGFTNPGMININTRESNETITNEMMSNNKPCEFIDFYPDRSLFSFIPKYNKDRRRIEKNWDYCITYPCEKDSEIIKLICGGENDSIKAKVKVVTNPSGVKLLQCSSLFKHSLKSGSYINFYYYMVKGGEIPEVVGSDNVIRPLKENYYEPSQTVSGRGETEEYSEEDLSFQKYQNSVRVYSVGDLSGLNKDRIFSVRYDDIKKIYPYFAAFGCFYKKVSNGTECSYYARKFKKIKNKNGENLLSDINKAGFAKNIYGDDISQIVFTDDVDVYGLKDENGRDLSEVFFTVIKRNEGNEEWYMQHDVSNENVEFSHCFGPLTTGIDFSGIDVNEEPFDYNIHYLHNIDSASSVVSDIEPITNTLSAWGDTILKGMPKTIESGVSINDDEFYGDIVEFNNYLYEKSVIGNFFHRFNTMQREIFDLTFRDIYQDVITHDDYDYVNLGSAFTVSSFYVNDTVSSMNNVENANATSGLVYGNICPEGYFYSPHIPIKIKEESPVTHSIAEYINYDKCEVVGQNVVLIYKRTPEGDILIGKRYIYDWGDDGDDGRGEENLVLGAATSQTNTNTESIYFVQGIDGFLLTVRVPEKYSFIKGDYVALYDKVNGDTKWCTVKRFKNRYLTLYLNDEDFSGLDILNHQGYFRPFNGERRYFMFWSADSVPSYAKLCMDSKTFSWKRLYSASEVDKNSDLFDLTFSNGCFYVQKNINFFLKRQDPRGEYGLSYPLFIEFERKLPNPMVKFVMDGTNKIDISIFDYVINNTMKTCY